MMLSCVGLLEVGSTIATLWEGELEDSAVFHFLDSAAIHPRSLVETSKHHMARQRRSRERERELTMSDPHSYSPIIASFDR